MKPLRFALALLVVFGSFTVSTSADKTLADIVVGGTYHMDLLTGDTLEGVVEAKDDSTIILESRGKPYTFKATLIRDYTLLSLPKTVQPHTDSASGVGLSEAEILPYEHVMHHGASTGQVDVRITNGSTFRGIVASADNEKLKLDVQGSIVPIAREVIAQISTVVKKKDTEKKEEKKPEPKGPMDTVHVVNSETDDYGRPKAPIVIVGNIKSDNSQGVTIETEKGTIRTFQRERILRVIKNTASPYEDKIKRYAAPLFCADDMILVDLPPGKPDRPFFKTCIDKYEYPNQKDAVPQGNVSYEDAQQVCESKGKRLCTQDEWQWACSGLEGYVYPYGWHMEKKRCNTKGVGHYAPSGSFHTCVGKFGVYDMVGNIFEWVTGNDGQPMLMGGPFSKCQTASPGIGGKAKPQTGFRCCKSN